MRSELTVTVNFEEGWDVPEALLERGACAVLEDAGVSAAEVSITLLADADIERLNRDYLGKERPTDVISFSLGDDDSIVGDVYLGYDQGLRQAAEEGVDVAEELLRLAIHGVLHVLGHDHPEGPERMSSPMFEHQERLVRSVLSA